MTHPQARREARIKETDEREMQIARTAAQFAGAVTAFVSAAALFVVLPLSMAAFMALTSSIMLYFLTFITANIWLSKRL